MNKISAEIVADSINLQGDRITTMLLTFPRFILSEFNTHRMFSRNSASSRALPFEKAVKMVEEDPFIPIAFQKQHKGMQGTEYFPNDGPYSGYEWLKSKWLVASYSAIREALDLHNAGVTKQICNRLLEPFICHKCLVTATEFENFFNLRCPQYHSPVDKDFLHKSKKDCIAAHSNPINLEKFKNFSIEDWQTINKSQAEIHIQALAEAMWDAMNESTPKKLKPGEWHIPFGDKMDLEKVCTHAEAIQIRPKIAVARCARLSYLTFDNKIDYEKDIQLHDQLLASRHMSPFEHCAKAMTFEEYTSFIKGEIHREFSHGDYIEIPEKTEGWCNNFRGFIQYRYLIENK